MNINRRMAFWLAAFLAGALSASAAEPLPPLSVEEAGALLGLIRARVAASPTERSGKAPAASLSVARTPPLRLFLTLYHRGEARFQAQAADPSPRASAEALAEELAGYFAGRSAGVKKTPGKRPGKAIPPKDVRLMRRQGRLKLDALLSHRGLRRGKKRLLMDMLDFGRDGVAVTAGDRTDYFLPATLLRHSNVMRPMQAMFHSMLSRVPPRDYRLAAIRTQAFIEAWPGGPPLELFRCNTLVPLPTEDRMIKSALAAGAWILSARQSDGGFIGKLHPLGHVGGQRPNLEQNLRIARSLFLLHRLTDSKKAYAKADKVLLNMLRHVKDIRLPDGRKLSYVYFKPADATLDVKSRPALATALLLSAHCYRESAREFSPARAKPRASTLMRLLGTYLAASVTKDGRLAYSPILTRAHSPSHARGPAPGEAMSALCLLYRIRKDPALLSAAKRLGDFHGPRRVARGQPAPATIVGLSELYRVTREKRYAHAVLQFTETLIRAQVQSADDKGKPTPPDDVGGFLMVSKTPDLSATSERLLALTAAYPVASLMKVPNDDIVRASRAAARFIINLQYRPANSFYITNRGAIEGAFRHSPRDLLIETWHTARAAEGLVGAAHVMVGAGIIRKKTER